MNLQQEENVLKPNILSFYNLFFGFIGSIVHVTTVNLNYDSRYAASTNSWSIAVLFEFTLEIGSRCNVSIYKAVKRGTPLYLLFNAAANILNDNERKIATFISRRSCQSQQTRNWVRHKTQSLVGEVIFRS